MSGYHQCFLAYMMALALGLFIVLLLEHFIKWRRERADRRCHGILCNDPACRRDLGDESTK